MIGSTGALFRSALISADFQRSTLRDVLEACSCGLSVPCTFKIVGGERINHINFASVAGFANNVLLL